MPENSECADCGGRMEEGFIPDAAYREYRRAYWHAGAPTWREFFGLSFGLKIHRAQMHPIRAFRCTKCGLLRSYA